MSQSNSEYWEQRVANQTWGTYNSLEEKNRALLEMYQEASLDVQEELYKVTQKINGGQGVSLSDMHKFNRLNGLQKNMEDRIRQLGEDVEKFGKDNMKSGIKDVYSNVMNKLGANDFSLPNEKLMEKMFNTPWQGNTFSNRLWKNTQILANNLNEILTIGLQQGKTITEMAINLNNRMNEGFNVTHRLVRTETMHYLNEASFKAYEDGGCEEVEILAAEDERMCEVCGKKHGQKYKLKDRPVLPLHANCRCTIIPVIDMKKIEENNKVIQEQKEKIKKLEKEGKTETYREYDIYKKYGEEHYNNIKGYVDKAPANVRKVWNKFEDKLRINDTNYKKGAYYSRREDGIKLNLKKDMLGNGYNSKYGTTFHECGHNIDYEINTLFGNGEKYSTISEIYKDGLLGRTIKEEALEKINTMHEIVEKAYKEKGLTATKADTYDIISKELRTIEPLARADISDMFEGATGAKVKGGYGHGASYWENRDNGKEAFAEMFNATMNNPDSLEKIKTYFPKSYKVFEEILELAIKGVN